MIRLPDRGLRSMTPEQRRQWFYRMGELEHKRRAQYGVASSAYTRYLNSGHPGARHSDEPFGPHRKETPYCAAQWYRQGHLST